MFDIEYEFNFCDTISRTCNGVEASAVEFLDVYEQETDTCEILGMGSQSLYRLLDEQNPSQGLLVAFMGGDICEGSSTPSEDGNARKVIFKLECGESQDDQFVLDEPNGSQGSTKCELNFKMKTPAACPGFVAAQAAMKKRSSWVYNMLL